MRIFCLNILILLCQIEIYGQVIRGHITDSKTNKPIEYVSIGIVNTTFGAISDEKGFFEFEYKAQDISSNVKISMIGYKSQIFSVKDLLQKDFNVRMIDTVYEIKEIVIKPTVEKIVGANGFDKSRGISGWAGLYDRKGYEIGIKLDLGNKPVKIKSLHVMIDHQAFDTCYFRLHIRSIRDTLILDELLTENIIVPISKESGWVDVNLENYNLNFSGEIGLTLEWLKVIGVNKARKMNVNNQIYDAYFLLKNKKKYMGLYRFGTEAKWSINKENSPSMYLKILK